MFYYVLLALTLAALALSYRLLGQRIGFYWRAIREDQEAAQAAGIDVFRYKIAAVALSATMTAIAGTLTAFYDNNLYPDTTFGIDRSIDVITAPIIGGLGTLFGPILGAFVLTVLSEMMTSVSASLGVNGLKQWIYGAALLVIVMLQPAGLWPWLKALLRLDKDNR
jgi:branched-chain amino acid transport system permease protein